MAGLCERHRGDMTPHRENFAFIHEMRKRREVYDVGRETHGVMPMHLLLLYHAAACFAILWD
jgi:hypothetical protein